jgi:hypothetical protein
MVRQRDFLIGLIVLTIGVIFTGNALDIWPGGLADILRRALPAVLIALGIGTFLRGRVPFSSIISLAIAAFLVVNIAVVGFSSRSGQQRDDQRVPLDQQVDESVTLLTIDVGVLSTDVEIALDTSAGRLVTGEFTGSRESAFTVDYVNDGTGRATLTLRETQPNPFPNLVDIGRGSLTLALPAGVGIDLALTGQQGRATLNLDQADLERLNVNLTRGDATITLPDYQPRSPTQATTENPNLPPLLGTLQVLDGSLTIAVPDGVGARFELNLFDSGVEREFDPTVFNELRQPPAIESRNIDTAVVKLRYAVVVPRGQIRIN